MAQQERNLPDVMSGFRVNPIREMTRLQRNIDRLFDEMMSPFFGGASGISTMPALPLGLTTGLMSRGILEEPLAHGFIPPVDVEETDQNFIVSFDLPGVSKNEVQIEVRDHQLIVTGERKIERTEEKGVRHAWERYHGAFSRTFTLPATVHADQIQAHFENGVLQVVIPKAEAAQRKTIQITEGKAIEGTHRTTTKGEKKEKVA